MDPGAAVLAPAPDILKQNVTGALPWFNMISLLIDVIPLWVVCCGNLATINNYFSVWNFINGALMNFALTCHILFALNPMEHLDTLVVAMVGMCLGTVYAYVSLLHKVATAGERSTREPRVWMFVFMLSLLAGSSVVVYGIAVGFHAREGWSKAIIVLALMAALMLNLVSCVQAVPGQEPNIADVDRYGMVMSFLATVDALFFVAYVFILGSFDTLFATISYITAVYSLIQFVVYLGKMSR